LVSSLNAQRDHVLGILEGLSEEALRRPVLPSGWTCLGLVRHLAIDVERFWFASIIAGKRSNSARARRPGTSARTPRRMRCSVWAGNQPRQRDHRGHAAAGGCRPAAAIPGPC